MSATDYDNPEAEERWCEEQRALIADYLRSQGIQHGQIAEWPAWHVAPYVAIWAVESIARPEWIGWWVVTGDLPTDYISAAVCQPPHLVQTRSQSSIAGGKSSCGMTRTVLEADDSHCTGAYVEQ